MSAWYETTKRWCQTNLTEDDLQRSDLSFWQRFWREQAIQGVIINCGGIVSYFNSPSQELYRPVQLGETDLYGLYHTAARAMGLTVIARMDINSMHEAFYRKHTDWFCVDRDGHPVMTQGRYVACVSGGYYRQFIPRILQEIIERYHPDGFADNSWAGLGRQTVCYCHSCRNGFFEATGLDLPQSASWDDVAYAPWIRWNYRQRVDIWQLFNTITRQAGGEDCRWFGMLHANPFHAGDRFVDLRSLLQMTPFVFCDHQSRDELNGFEQNSINGDLLRLAAGGQVPVAQSMAHYFRGIRTYRLSAAAPGEVRLWMLAGFAGGILPWLHFVSGNQEDRRRFQLSGDLIRFHRQHENRLSGRTPTARIAVLWSQDNIDFYGRDQVVERCEYPWRGMIHALSEQGVPVLPLHADDLLHHLEDLSLLILPDLAVLSDEQTDVLLDWLKRGGSLVLSQRSGLLDPDGQPREQTRLWQTLGLSGGRRMIGLADSGSAAWTQHETHSYLRLPAKDRHPILAGFSETDILPFGGRVLAMRSDGPLRPVLTYIPPFPIYPPEFSWIRGEQSDIAPMLAGELPEGGRVVYLAGDLDRCYGRYQTPDLGRLLFQAIQWAAGDRLGCRVEAPGHVHAALSVHEDGLMIQLINLAGADGPLGTCRGALPIGPVKLILDADLLKEGTVADGQVSGERVSVEPLPNGQWLIQLEKLQEHELLLCYNNRV